MLTKIFTGGRTGKLNSFDGWAIGSGAMIGASIFILSGKMSGAAGPAAALSFIVAAFVVSCIALCFAEVASAYPRSGGAYIYPKEVFRGKFGEYISFISGLAFYGGQGLGASALSLTFAFHLSWSLSILGISTPIPDNTIAIIAIVFFGAINIIDIKFCKIIQYLSTFLVIFAIVLFIVVGGTHFKVENYANFAPFGIKGFFEATTLGWAAFGGWSAIPNIANEFKDPIKDVRNSMLSSLLTCAILFSLIVFVMNGIMSYQELNLSKAPVADAFASISPNGALIVALGGIFAAVSTLNALIMSCSHLICAMSQEGSLPALFSLKSTKGIPWVAILVTMAGQIFLASTGLIYFIMQMVFFATGISWIITCICMVYMRIRRKDIVPSFRAPLFPIVPLVAICLPILMLHKYDLKVKFICLGWVIFSTILFLIIDVYKRYYKDKWIKR